VYCPWSMCRRLPDRTAVDALPFLGARCSKGQRRARTLASDRATCPGS